MHHRECLEINLTEKIMSFDKGDDNRAMISRHRPRFLTITMRSRVFAHVMYICVSLQIR